MTQLITCFKRIKSLKYLPLASSEATGAAVQEGERVKREGRDKREGDEYTLSFTFSNCDKGSKRFDTLTALHHFFASGVQR